MGLFDDYRREERPRLEPGDYRVKIADVESTTSKAGNPMIVITLTPNGSDLKINHYIVKNEYFNRNMTEFFDSFNVDEGDFNLPGWVGAVGAAKLVHDDNGYLKVRWLIRKDKQNNLPPWIGGEPKRQEVTSAAAFTAVDTNDDLPF